jgi:thioredoxin reductase (NADPH)
VDESATDLLFYLPYTYYVKVLSVDGLIAHIEFGEIAIDGFFLAIGHTPNTKVFADYLTLTPEGYIQTEGASSKTNIEGVFAAGDVKDPFYRQAIAAAGSGCAAALDCERFLMEHK